MQACIDFNLSDFDCQQHSPTFQCECVPLLEYGTYCLSSAKSVQGHELFEYNASLRPVIHIQFSQTSGSMLFNRTF